MSSHRMERLSHQVQEEIALLLVSGKIKDPRVDSLLSITRVEVSKDLAWADVHVSSVKAGKDLDRAVMGLQSAAGFIQASLGAKLHIRQTPRLRFHADHSLKDGFELVRKIEDLTD